MTRPTAARLTMTIFTVALLALCITVHQGLVRAFISNPYFNSGILVTLLFGIVASYRQILRIDKSVKWIHSFKGSQSLPSDPPFLLVPLSSVLQKSDAMPYIGATSLRAMLDGVFTRVDESRDLSRYLMNVLILLGLLGTFWGLLETVGGIGAVIGGLSVGEGDIKTVFNSFKTGLERPLLGMGVSFSASLFGLASSLILGFLDLQTGRAQNLFCSELEEWLGRRSAIAEQIAQPHGSHPSLNVAVPPANYQEALIVAVTEQLERLHKSMRQQHENQISEQGHLRSLAEAVAALNDNVKAHHMLMAKLTQIQNETTPALSQLVEVMHVANSARVEEHVRNVDVSLKEISRQLSSAATNHTTELRDELRVIAKLLAAEAQKNDTRMN